MRRLFLLLVLLHLLRVQGLSKESRCDGANGWIGAADPWWVGRDYFVQDESDAMQREIGSADTIPP